MNTKAYKIMMSKGDAIPVDADELPNIIKAIQAGDPCVVRQGIFNPSFYVSIILDKERVLEIEGHNHNLDENARKFHTKVAAGEYKEMQPLKSIFQDMKLLK